MEKVDKDPQAVLDYGFEWAEWLGADTIDTSEWTGSDGITIDSETEDVSSGTTAVWLSGGSLGKSYKLVNRVTTTNVPPRIEERTLVVTIKNR